MQKKLNTLLKEKFGEDNMIWGVDNYQVYFNHNLIKEKNIDIDKVKAETLKALKADPTKAFRFVCSRFRKTAEAAIP